MRTRPRHWGYLTAGWCVLFAALHVYWAAGGALGLASSAGVDLATRRPWWFVLGGLWGVAAVLLAGAGFGVGLARWTFSGTPRRLVVALGWLGGGLLVVRGLVLEVLLATGPLAAAVGPAQTRWSLLLWNPWFVLGGVLVLLATYRFQSSGVAVRASPSGVRR